MGETLMVLEGEREIVISRTFAAPARVVFDAWTRPEFVRRWWAPASMCVVMIDCTADVRVGGAYRYVLESQGEAPIAFSGEYIEVDPPRKLVYSHVFEPMAHAGSALITVTFDERDGRTALVSRERYPSAAVRDAVIASGMEHGMRATMNQLDELVRSLR